MIFLKSVLGGIAAVVAVWIVVVCTFAWRTNAAIRRQGITGLYATAGGWEYLLQKPLVDILLMLAFGVGLLLTARWASN